MALYKHAMQFLTKRILREQRLPELVFIYAQDAVEKLLLPKGTPCHLKIIIPTL